MPRWKPNEPCSLMETCPYSYSDTIRDTFCRYSYEGVLGPIFCPRRSVPDEKNPNFFAMIRWSEDRNCLAYLRLYAYQAIRKWNVWPEMWPVFMALISDSDEDVKKGMEAAGISLDEFKQKAGDPNVLIPWLKDHFKLGYPPAVRFHWNELLSK